MIVQRDFSRIAIAMPQDEPSVFEIAGGFLCIINVILLRRTRNIEFASFIILFLMLCLFVSLIVFGGEDKTGLFWFFTFHTCP